MSTCSKPRPLPRRLDEGFLHGVLGIGEITGQGEELDDQARVRHVVHLSHEILPSHPGLPPRCRLLMVYPYDTRGPFSVHQVGEEVERESAMASAGALLRHDRYEVK